MTALNVAYSEVQLFMGISVFKIRVALNISVPIFDPKFDIARCGFFFFFINICVDLHVNMSVCYGTEIKYVLNKGTQHKGCKYGIAKLSRLNIKI